MEFLPDIDVIFECRWLLLTLTAIGSAQGFIAGWLSMRFAQQIRFRGAARNPGRMFDLSVENLMAARNSLNCLDRIRSQELSTLQTERLVCLQSALSELLRRLLGPAQPETATTARLPGRNPPRWRRAPLHPATDTPDRLAFDQNLAALLDSVHETHQPAALLLMQVDRLSGLLDRFGPEGAQKIMRRLVGLVARALREEDLICQLDEDLLGILVLNTDLREIEQIARFVRDSVKNHRFRLENGGPEVLVTCSLGLTLCRPVDTAEIVLDRATNALERSHTRGRNQLHVHTGDVLAEV